MSCVVVLPGVEFDREVKGTGEKLSCQGHAAYWRGSVVFQ